MISFHKYNSKERAPELIKLLKEGNTIAEISDAGMPVISDPGYILVQECIKMIFQLLRFQDLQLLRQL